MAMNFYQGRTLMHESCRAAFDRIDESDQDAMYDMAMDLVVKLGITFEDAMALLALTGIRLAQGQEDLFYEEAKNAG